MKIGRWILLALLLSGAGVYAARRYSGSRIFGPESVAVDSFAEIRAPRDTRIKVEVLNATQTRGLARRATTFLRDRGFDVVAVGTAREQRAATLVLDRSNHPEWADLVARAFGATVEPRPDSLRYLDVTVLIGGDWRPPPLPFYP